MQRSVFLMSWAVASCLAASSSVALAQYAEEQTVQSAAVILNEAMATAGNQIPRSMLEDAHGVAIIPNVVKGSFIVGARHGRGLLFVREPSGLWRAPVFITLTGGNLGWQIGVQSSDIVLVFKTPRSVEGILSGKLTLGADVAAAAGPVGREGAIATDGQLRAEIYTYSRTRGLFAGISVDGSVLRIDRFATGSYYGAAGPGQPVTVPPAAAQLTQVIAAYAGSDAMTPAPGYQPAVSPRPDADQPGGVVRQPGIDPNAGFVQQYGARASDVLRNQLVEISPRLFNLLDERWTAYLALPMAFIRDEDPQPAALQESVRRFDAVAADPRFRQLAGRPEFQSVHALLRQYQQSLSTDPAPLQLPPPPQ